jgi:UDP-N-acetylglucosamine/UDP-N-acetylgalactosamine diphosphorylase
MMDSQEPDPPTDSLADPLRQQLEPLLRRFGQQHLIQFWEKISNSQRLQLADQIRSLDWTMLDSLDDPSYQQTDWGQLAEQAESPPAITLSDYADRAIYSQACALGQAALAANKVGLILVAGGQGTRLGFDQPKGMFPLGPLSGRTLFQLLVDLLKARRAQFKSSIPLYVMTSPATHSATLDYFGQHQQLGLPADDLHFFTQGTMPAIDADRKLILADRDQIFLSPDGHGGMLDALRKNQLLADIQSRGIEYLFYAQVDNPLVQLCDPALIGFHILRQSEMTTQVVRKQDPLQRVGNVVKIGDRLQIIEYSDLPETQARMRDARGELKLWAGSIAVHIFNTQFLLRCAADQRSLPFHRAWKKVPFIDPVGERVEPQEPNATKFEKFIFDLLPLAENALVCEVDPAEGFAAVKNAPPAKSETPEHSRQALMELHRRWLRSAAVEVSEGIKVEINPRFALSVEELKSKLPPGSVIREHTYFDVEL